METAIKHEHTNRPYFIGIVNEVICLAVSAAGRHRQVHLGPITCADTLSASLLSSLRAIYQVKAFLTDKKTSSLAFETVEDVYSSKWDANLREASPWRF